MNVRRQIAVFDSFRSSFFEKDGFPHEVGLFLGYPLDDVTGFIEQKGKNYKCCGIWKVYGNEKQTQMLFPETEEMFRNLQTTFCGWKINSSADCCSINRKDKVNQDE